MTNTYKILGQGLTSDLLAPGSTVRKATVYEVPQNTNAAVSAINITNSGDDEATYDLAFVKDADVSLETENVQITVNSFYGFVAIPSYGATGAYSEDGITWTTSTLTPQDQMYGRKVGFGNGVFITTGYNMLGGTGWARSTNGINWTTFTAPGTSTHVSRIRFINNKFFVIFQNTPSIHTSEDGITWTIITPQYMSAGMTTIYSTDIAYGNGTYVLTDYMSPILYYSTDLLNWTAHYFYGSANSQFSCITYGNGKFVAPAMADYGNWAYSSDGVNWSVTDIIEARARAIVYAQNKFVVTTNISRDSVMYSTDGINWTIANTGGSNFAENNPPDITYGNGLFVIGGPYSIKTSPDAITWTERTTPTSGGMAQTWYSLASSESITIDSYSIPKTLYKHRIVSRKSILPGETQEIKGGITLSAGDQIRVISSADEIITNVYGVEIS